MVISSKSHVFSLYENCETKKIIDNMDCESVNLGWSKVIFRKRNVS